MNPHDNIVVCEADKTTFIPLLETFEDKLSIPRTVAHYTSPQTNGVSSSKQSVAEVMKSFGMDVIPICGDQLAEE